MKKPKAQPKAKKTKDEKEADNPLFGLSFGNALKKIVDPQKPKKS